MAVTPLPLGQLSHGARSGGDAFVVAGGQAGGLMGRFGNSGSC
jgi:hypothetical protein